MIIHYLYSDLKQGECWMHSDDIRLILLLHILWFIFKGYYGLNNVCICLGVGVLPGHEMLRAYIGTGYSEDYSVDQSEICAYHDEMLRVLKHCNKLLYLLLIENVL